MDGDLDYFRDWFGRYCRTYYREDRLEQLNITLKEEHSLHVAGNAAAIASGEALSLDECLIAEVAALLHDIGRFPQYARYKTFLDSISVNHGQLGAETLTSLPVLTALSEKERNRVIDAVRFHNAYTVPERSDPDAARLIRLVRDADKIDIWRVVCEFYEGCGKERADAVSLGFPDLPHYSKEVIADIMDKKVAKLAYVRTLNDLKLLQLSWVFDLNYRSSFILAAQKDCVSRMAGLLPVTDDVSGAVSVIQAHVNLNAGA